MAIGRSLREAWTRARRVDPGRFDVDQLVAAGCRPERTAVVMGAPLAALELGDPEGEPASADEYHTVAEAVDFGGGSLGAQQRFVARRDGRPVAIASTFVHGTTAVVLDLAVLDEYRRQGIGRTLLAHALQLDVTHVVLGPTPESIPLAVLLCLPACRTPSPVPERCAPEQPQRPKIARLLAPCSAALNQGGRPASCLGRGTDDDRRVLVVDDHPFLAEAVSSLLRDAGINGMCHPRTSRCCLRHFRRACRQGDSSGAQQSDGAQLTKSLSDPLG